MYHNIAYIIISPENWKNDLIVDSYHQLIYFIIHKNIIFLLEMFIEIGRPETLYSNSSST